MRSFSALRDDPDMSNALASRRPFGPLRWLGLVVVTGLLLPFLTESAAAQVYQDRDAQGQSVQERRPEGQSPVSPPGSSTNLPDWAEPSQPQGEGMDKSAVETRAPDPPDNPSRIPVDGGVALLAAAGAGYAVRKLNEEDEEDPPA